MMHLEKHLSSWKQPDLSSWSQGTWQVVGEDSQALMVVLKAGERIMTEPGGMLHSAPGLRPKADTGGPILPPPPPSLPPFCLIPSIFPSRGAEYAWLPTNTSQPPTITISWESGPGICQRIFLDRKRRGSEDGEMKFLYFMT